MNQDKILEGENLIRKIEKIQRFGSKYNAYPYEEIGPLVNDLSRLSESIPDIENPLTHDEVIYSELKRRLKGDADSLKQSLIPKYYDFDTIISLFGIPKEDLQALRPWLESNKEKTIETVRRLFKSKEVQSYEMGLSLDIPGIRVVAEQIAGNQIRKYHQHLGKLLQNLTNVGGFLRDINAVPSYSDRSYFNLLTNTLALGIPAICSSKEDGTVELNERILIELYGHEGMGHALQNLVTLSNGIPYFLKTPSDLTRPTSESVAQFYQKVIFEDLKNSPETQKELGIKHKFEEIYQENEDTIQLKDFHLKLSQYGITVLADKSLGDPKEKETQDKKIDLLSQVSISPTWPLGFVAGYSNSFDPNGNLDHRLVKELVYCAQPVQRALKEFAKEGINYDEKGRNLIDATLLKGFWTPIGYVENARIAAKNKIDPRQ